MTATKSNINVKIDTAVKEAATTLLDRMGIDQTTAIDMLRLLSQRPPANRPKPHMKLFRQPQVRICVFYVNKHIPLPVLCYNNYIEFASIT